MPRNVPSQLATHLALPTTTICRLLKISPLQASNPVFGICTAVRDVKYDDGKGDGVITYKCANGYTPMDLVTSADLAVGNTEAQGLLADTAADGVTAVGIASGAYDDAGQVQYLVNYNDLTTSRHIELNSGTVGQVTNINNQQFHMELRSLTQTLKQNTMIELTSITDRAAFGDSRNKMTLRFYNSAVASLGAEPDRTFTLGTLPGYTNAPGDTTGTLAAVQFGVGDGVTNLMQLLDTAGAAVTSGFTVTRIKSNGTTLTLTSDYTVDGAGIVTFVHTPASGVLLTWDGTIVLQPDGYFVPGLVHWITGPNAGRENEIETYVNGTGVVTLKFPTREDIQVGDTLSIRRDSDKSKTGAIADGNLPNMRAESDMPRADSAYLQSPTASG